MYDFKQWFSYGLNCLGTVFVGCEHFCVASDSMYTRMEGFGLQEPQPKEFSITLPKFNSSPLKSYLPNRKGSSSNHHFSGAMLNFGGVILTLRVQAAQLFCNFAERHGIIQSSVRV